MGSGSGGGGEYIYLFFMESEKSLSGEWVYILQVVEILWEGKWGCEFFKKSVLIKIQVRDCGGIFWRVGV